MTKYDKVWMNYGVKLLSHAKRMYFGPVGNMQVCMAPWKINCFLDLLTFQDFTMCGFILFNIPTPTFF